MPYNGYDAKRVLAATFDRLRNRDHANAVRDIADARPSPIEPATIDLPLTFPSRWEARRGG